MAYLVPRKGSANWYYRETLPADVRSILLARDGTAPGEVWISLRSPDRRVARMRLPEVRAGQHRLWDELRKGEITVGGIPSLSELAEAAIDFVHERFVEIHQQQLRLKMEQGLDLSSEARRRREKIVQMSLLPSASDVVDMERLAAAVCRSKQWGLKPGKGIAGDRWDELVLLITKAVQLGRAEIVETLEGRTRTTSREHVLRRLGAKPAQRVKAGESILDLFDRYAKDATRDGKAAETLGTERKVIEHFARFVGAEKAVSEIGRADIREFRQALLAVPRRWTARAELRGLGIAEAAAKWEATGGAVRSPRTVARELSAISTMWGWLMNNAFAEVNPTLGFSPKYDKEKGKFPPYTNEQLRALFGTPLFHRCDLSSGKLHLVGDAEIRDWRYWMPLCALYSGARAAEIAQLFCSDVREEEGVWVLDLVLEEGEIKKLKSRKSRRLVPIHRALVNLGFVKYVERMRADGNVRVFPQIKPGPSGGMGAQPSKFWQAYSKKIGLGGQRGALHRFRHTFVDECRRRGVSKDILQALLGHADNSITAHYGSLTEGNLDQRKRAIDTLSFDNLHALPR